MRFEAIIFDLDGVICYTDKCHHLAWKVMADTLDDRTARVCPCSR